MNKKIQQLLYKLWYFYHIPHPTPQVNDDNGYRWRKDCLCCTIFMHTYQEWQQRKGHCELCGNISEYGVCRKFVVKSIEQMANLNEWKTVDGQIIGKEIYVTKKQYIGAWVKITDNPKDVK